MVLQLVANEQDNCTILTLSIRVLGWIEGFLDTWFLIWHHYEDVMQLIHLQLCCCENEDTFQRCLSLAVTKNWPPLKFIGKNYKILVEKIGIHLIDTPVVSILLFPRAVIKQFINWPINKIFWNTVRNLPFLFCVQSRVDKVFKTFDKNFIT